MRKLVVIGVVLLVVTSLTELLLSPRVSYAAQIQKANPTEDVAYRCQNVWRCDYRGCGWRRGCWRYAKRYIPYGWAYPYDWQAYHFVWQ